MGSNLVNRVNSHVSSLLEPESLVFFGASKSSRLGGRIVINVAGSGFGGTLVVVSKDRPDYLELPGLSSVEWHEELGDERIFDIAVLGVPGAAAPKVLEENKEKIRNAVVISALPPGEAGDEVAAALRSIHEQGVGVLGPNTAGMYLGENAPITFSKALAPETKVDDLVNGAVAVVSQSGAFGVRLVTGCRARGVGIQSFISVGNEVGYSVADVITGLVQHTQRPPKCILLYVESVQDGYGLIDACVLAAQHDIRIVVLPAGRSAVGAKAAVSHTDALVQPADVLAAALRQAGACVVHSDAALIDAAVATAVTERRNGSRIGIVTGSGGFGVVAADLLSDVGLEVPELSGALQEKLMEVLPAFASPVNPVDVTGQAGVDPSMIDNSINAVVSSGEVDAIVFGGGSKAINFPSTRSRNGVAIVSAEVDSTNESQAEAARQGVAVFPSLVNAINALETWSKPGVASGLTKWNTPPPTPEDSVRVSGAFEAARSLGIAIPRWRVGNTASDAVAAGDEFGWPVVVKGNVESAEHKAAAGMVRVNVTREAMPDVVESMKEADADVVVCEMIAERYEWFVSVTWSDAFGWLTTIGVGGSMAEEASMVTTMPYYADLDWVVRYLEEQMPSLANGKMGKQLPEVTRFVHDLVPRIAISGWRTVELNPVVVRDGRAVALDVRLL